MIPPSSKRFLVDLRGEVMLPDMKKGVFVNELKTY